MRRRLRLAVTALAAAVAFAGAPATQAQLDAAPSAATTDVPTGPAAIRGRVVHATKPAAAANVDVVLYALPPSGNPGVRRARTDASGAFAFEGIGNDPAIAYLVGARYGDVPFPGARVSFQPGETERSVEVKIADATPDTRGVETRDGVVELERTASGLHVTESWHLANAGERVVSVPPAARARAKPAFAATLPAGSTNLQYPLGMKPDGLVQRGDALLFFGPVYPGTQELTYSYDVPRRDGGVELGKTLATGAGALRVRAPLALGALQAPGFAPVDDASAREAGIQVVEAKALPPGQRVSFRLQLAPLRDDPALLFLDEVALQVELDQQAMLFVHERWSLRVAGDAPLAGSLDAPLLRIPLPDDADDLRFSPESQRLGLAPDPRGGLALTGPLPPGESTLELVYRSPVAATPVDLSLELEKPTPLLSVYVSDNGVVATSERLHRRRPVRSEDGAFLLHLEAFDVEAGESVSLRLAPLPPAAPRSALVVGGVVVVSTAIAGVFLFWPLGGRLRSASLDETELPLLRRERESLYTAIRDLDDDHETGKIDDQDWRSMREDLRRRALALLATERAAGGTGAGGAAAEPEGIASTTVAACDACGVQARTGDRFCARCGARLASREAASA